MILLQKRSVVLAAALVAGLGVVAGCKVDERYSIDNIKDTDTTLDLFQEGVEIPIGSTQPVTLGELMDMASKDNPTGDYIRENENGDYSIHYGDTLDLSDQLSSIDLSSLSNIDAITVNETMNYHLGVNKDDLSIKAQSFENTISLPSFDVTIPTLPSLNQSSSQATEIYKRAPGNKFDLSSSVSNVNYSNEICKGVASLIPTGIPASTEIDLASSIPTTTIEPYTKNISFNQQLTGVKSIKNIKLASNAKMTVKLTAENPLITSGTVTPNVKINLDNLFTISGVSGSEISLSSLTLTNANNYTASKEYSLTGLGTTSYASGTISINKDVTVSGSVEVSNAKTTPAKVSASTAAGGMKLKVEISFSNLTIDSADVEIEPVEVNTSAISLDLNFNPVSLPSQVEAIEKVTLNTAKKLSVNVSADNLSSVTGLSVALNQIELQFPEGVEVEGATAGKLTLSGTVPFSKEITVKSITLPAPKNGSQSFSGKVNVSAKATASGTINTKNIPTTAANDVVVKSAVSGQLEISDYSVKIKEYSSDVTLDQDFNVELKGVGDLGSFTIIPDGTPAIQVALNLPSVSGLNISTAAEGIKITVPSMVVLKSSAIASNLNYNSKDNSITIKGEIPSVISLPIEKLNVAPVKKEGDVYEVKGKMNVSGAAKVAAATINKASVEAISGSKIEAKVTIPTMKAASVSLNEDLSFNIDEQKTSTTLLKASDVPDVVKSITEIKLDDVYLNASVNVEGLPDLGSSKFHVSFNAQLPEYIDPHVIKIEGDLDSKGKLSINPIKINGIKNLDLSTGKDITADISYSGSISAANPSIDINTLNSDIKATVNVSLGNDKGKIDIGKISARCKYDLDMEQAVSFSGVPDFFKGENVTLDFANPQILIDLTTNISIPINASLNLVPVTNGVSGKAIDIKINLPVSDNTNESKTLKLCIGDNATACPSGYDFAEADIVSLLKSIPDSLKLSVKGGIDDSKDCTIDPDAKYELSLAYVIDMPLKLGKDFHVSYCDTLDFDLKQSLGSVSGLKSLGLKGTIENSIPLDLGVGISWLDASYNVIKPFKDEVKLDIKGCTTEGTAQVSDFDLTLDTQNESALEAVKKIMIQVNLESKADKSLNRNDYIKMTLKAALPEGISINMGGSKDNDASSK